MKSMFTMAFAVTLGFGLFALMERSAGCADCMTDNLAGLRKAFTAFEEQCRKHLAAPDGTRDACFSSNIYNKVLPIMKALGKDNRFGPAERVLIIGDTQNGTLTTGNPRILQTAAPLDADSVTVRFTRVGGHIAVVKLCAAGEDGTIQRVGTISFGGTDGPSERSATVSGVRGKILRIDMAGGGAAGTKIQYTLSTR